MDNVPLVPAVVAAIRAKADHYGLTKGEQEFVAGVLSRMYTDARECALRALRMAELAPNFERGLEDACEITRAELHENENERRAQWLAGIADQPRPELLLRILSELFGEISVLTTVVIMHPTPGTEPHHPAG